MIRAARDVLDRCVEVLEAIYGSAPPIACEACGQVPADLRLPRLVCMSCHHQAMQEAAVGHVCEDCGGKAAYADPRLESRPLCWPCWSDGLVAVNRAAGADPQRRPPKAGRVPPIRMNA